MTLPVLPPIRPRALPTPRAAPLIAGPADDVTLERPSDAFDDAVDAAVEAFVAPSAAMFAAVEVVELFRRLGRRRRMLAWRKTAREEAILLV